MSLVVDEHREYLRDVARVSAFREAICETVRPGDVVLDLASGTGILGLLACRAGAKHVYSIEVGGMIELARAICRTNGYADRVTFIKGHSTQVELPEKVDVAVCDQIGRFGFEAGVSQFFDDVRKRFLKPGGRLIPTRIDLIVTPVECAEICNNIEFWGESPAGFDFGPARTWAANTGYPVKLLEEQLLGDPAQLASLDLTQGTLMTVNGEVEIRVNRPGTLHGIGGWFSAQLSPGVTLSNSPLSPQSINRRNVFFPLDRPIQVAPGDHVQIQMSIMPKETMVTWKVKIYQSKTNSGGADSLKAKFFHSTFSGMLLCKEDLLRNQPSFIPTLNPWGKARSSVLELCDGVRSVADIEREVQRRHAGLFPTQGAAAAFVAEVIIRYAR